MSYKTKKVAWKQIEDNCLTKLVEDQGANSWAKKAEKIYKMTKEKRKTGRQCRERWFNQLNPEIEKKNWTPQQDDILFQEHQKHGSKWCIIAEKFIGRSQNSIKNHFYSTVRKILRRILKFIGSKDSTEKIQKIKPSTLSRIFQMSSIEKQIDNSSSQQAMLYSRLKFDFQKNIYQFLNFSRRKFSQKGQTLKDNQLKMLEESLQQLQKINEQYQKIKYEQTKLRREKNLYKNFDKVIELLSESDQEDQDYQQKNKKIQKIESRVKRNLIDKQTQNMSKQSILYSSREFQSEKNLLSPKKTSFKNNQKKSQTIHLENSLMNYKNLKQINIETGNISEISQNCYTPLSPLISQFDCNVNFDDVQVPELYFTISQKEALMAHDESNLIDKFFWREEGISSDYTMQYQNEIVSNQMQEQLSLRN